MVSILRDLLRTPLNWLLVFVPAVLVMERASPDAHTALFLLSVLAIVPLAGLLSHATEGVAAKTGDAVGGLLNATLGNLTELVIAITALRAGMLDLVKASMTGAVVTNSLFMLGGAFLLGGLKHRTQEFNPANARIQTGMLLLATIALLIPSAVAQVDALNVPSFAQPLSLALSAILLITYALSLLFSLKTHREFFASAGEGEHDEAPWPLAFSAGHAGGSHAADRARQRGLRRVGAARGAGARHVARLRRLHRRVAGGRGRRDDLGVLGRAQEPPRHERRHRHGQFGRRLRCSSRPCS